MSPRARTNISSKFPFAKRLNEILGDEINLNISKITGINSGTVAGYMKGTQQPSAEFLAALAAEGYDVHYILTGQKEKKAENTCNNTQQPAVVGSAEMQFRMIELLIKAARIHGGKKTFDDWCEKTAKGLQIMVDKPELLDKASEIIGDSDEKKKIV